LEEWNHGDLTFEMLPRTSNNCEIFHRYLNQLCNSAFWQLVDFLLNMSEQTSKVIHLLQVGKLPEVTKPKRRQEKYHERRSLKLIYSNPPARNIDLLTGYDFHCETFARVDSTRLGLELADEW
jgi:hypothetical protein